MSFDKISNKKLDDGFPPPQRMQTRPLIVLLALGGSCIAIFAAVFWHI